METMMRKRPKGLYILGTGTDVGKTYITALWLKRLQEFGESVAYYKAAISGATCVGESDGGYVKKIASLPQDDSTLVPYVLKEAVSPHLAARHEGIKIDRNVVNEGFCHLLRSYEYVTVEGSGGIICPLHIDKEETYMLEDVVKDLQLPTLLVATAALGTINSTVLTVSYLQQKQIPVKGIIMNQYTGSPMEEDNIKVIERMTGIPVIDTVGPDEESLHIDHKVMLSCYDAIRNPHHT